MNAPLCPSSLHSCDTQTQDLRFSVLQLACSFCSVVQYFTLSSLGLSAFESYCCCHFLWWVFFDISVCCRDAERSESLFLSTLSYSSSRTRWLRNPAVVSCVMHPRAMQETLPLTSLCPFVIPACLSCSFPLLSASSSLQTLKQKWKSPCKWIQGKYDIFGC